MEYLNKNGEDYYKTKEYWTPKEAVGFVMGLEIEAAFYTPDLYKQFEPLLSATAKVVEDKKLSVYKEIIEESSGFDFHAKYCPTILCRQDDVYEKQTVSCFRPLEYMWWIISEKVVRISERIGVKRDDEGNLSWTYPPDYKEERGKTFESDRPLVLEKRSKYYKGLKYWTIVEGACLAMGQFPNKEAPYNRHGNLVDVIERAYATGEIQAILNGGQWGETPCFAPFALLECWKKAGFETYPLFDFTKTVNDAGETVYRWADDETLPLTEEGNQAAQIEGQNKNIIHVDLDDPDLSEELKIAIQAYNAVYVRGKRNDKKGHLDNIKAWLKNNYPSLSKAAIERIATVVNPNKAGGSPSLNSDQ